MKATISIIGYGRVGRLLQKTLQKAGYNHISVIRNDDSIVFLNDIVLIAVPDNKVQSVVDEIHESGLKLKGKTFVHTSGILGLDVFSEFSSKKVKFGCMHPLMAVTETSESFEEITFDVCGDDKFIKEISPIIEDLNAQMLIVNESQKSKLHIAAVITSNYMITLMGLAQEVFSDSEFDQEKLKRAMLPLMKSALTNLENSTPSNALTGPISRGDVNTIINHLNLLEDQPELCSVYRKLGSETLRVLVNPLLNDSKPKLEAVFNET